MTVLDHPLLAQAGVFGEPLGAAARQVSQRTGEGVGERGLGHALEELIGGASQTVPNTFGAMSETFEHNGQYCSQPEL